MLKKLFVLAALATLVAAECLAEFARGEERWKTLPFWIKAPVCAALLLAVMNLGVPHEKPFIYFQF